VALGHIHKPQDLNEGQHPPVIYPGSIERVDFGEARDEKFYIIAEVEKGQTQVEWRKLDGVRPFIDCRAALGSALSGVEGSALNSSAEHVTESLLSVLPQAKKLEGAIVRLTVEYPREWDTLIDDAALRKHTEGCFEFHLVKRPQVEARIRLPADQTVSSLSPLDLLDQYWSAAHIDERDRETLQKLASEILDNPFEQN
jgi:exonuclease SbcD